MSDPAKGLVVGFAVSGLLWAAIAWALHGLVLALLTAALFAVLDLGLVAMARINHHSREK